MNARAVALAALDEWRRGRQFADAIIQRRLADNSLGAADRAFATELFYGILRNLTLLDFWIDHLRSGALDHRSRDLLRLGLYQIFLLQTSAHAAVFETVELAERRNRGLINGVLRNAVRQEKDLREAAETAPLKIRLSHPEFLLERWRTRYDADSAVALAEWNNQPAPVYARNNRLRSSPNECRNFSLLTQIPTEAISCGEIYIQDPSTALAVDLLDPQPNETILDACAAPGGKSGLIAEAMRNTGSLIACDRDPARLKILRGNLDRLGVTNAEVLQCDWPNHSLGKKKFDRILVDAPCSNTGVMRRRVDVRWRLRPNDFLRMPKEQLTILRAVVPLLARDGVLVYSTCSIEAEENEEVVEKLLTEFSYLRLLDQKSLLPFRDNLDGAFAAKFCNRET